MKLLLPLALLLSCDAVNLRSNPKTEAATCTPACRPNCPQSSRPGVPCIPPAKTWPFKSNTSWRVDLGERILKAVTPVVKNENCGGFVTFGDATWCNNSMHGNEKDTVGLSFGVEGRDMWSEKMSNMFGRPTKLFDCYASDASSPPLAGKVPNGIGKGKCAKVGSHCYETHYQAFHTCLGYKKQLMGDKQFDSLEDSLAGQGPLSVHLKMDVEGSEWSVLHQLLKEDKEMAKIRTLDMEVHFGFQSKDEPLFKGLSERQALELEVQVIESLGHGGKFEVTGSSLEVYREGWHPDQDCPTHQCNEPSVHLAGGYSLPQFAVSFVNKALLK